MRRRWLRVVFAMACGMLPTQSVYGSQEWQRSWSGTVFSPAVYAGDGAVVFGAGNQVIVYNPSANNIAHRYLRTYFIGGTVAGRIALVKGNSESGERFEFEADRPPFEQVSVYASANNGTVHRIRLTTGDHQQRDLRRASCPEDSLGTGPLFVSDHGSDPGVGLLIVGTDHKCGDKIENQVIALHSDDLGAAPAWVFNIGEYQVGRITSCISDPRRVSIYCTALRAEGTGQSSVFSIKAATGELNWAVDAGPIVAPPAFAKGSLGGSDRLYVGNSVGDLHRLDPDTGATVWSISMRRSSGSPASVSDLLPMIGHDIALGTDAYAGTILVTRGNGQVTSLYDSGAEAIEQWTTDFGGHRAVTGAEIWSSLGKAYVGLNNGTMHQLDMNSGTDEVEMTISHVSTDSNMSGLLRYEDSNGMHLVATAISETQGTLMAQFRIPCPYGAPNCATSAPIVPPAIPVPAPVPVPAQPPAVPAPAPQPDPPPFAVIPHCQRTDNALLVPATLGWCRTGIRLRGGERMSIFAQGRWSNSGPANVGPDGFTNYIYPGTVVGTAALASLVGKVDEGGFGIGSRYSAINARQGELLLSINDTPGTFGDNQGYVEVRITVTRPQ